jgi:hypothetical protein
VEPFELTKWYLDCVSERGDVFIGYSAELRWRTVHLHYASSLVVQDAGKPVERFSLRNAGKPVVHGDLLEWRCAPLKLRGAWRAIDEPLRATVYQSAAGRVEWQCFQPCARAEIDAGEGIHGLGYAECLTLSVPPWRMPIRELHWGRFLSETDAVVWIDWRGEHSTQLVFWNGLPVMSSEISDSELVLQQETTLSLRGKASLREGPLGAALARIPGLGRLAPTRILCVEEHKWRSRGVLRRPGSPEVFGWAIHEVVTWP